MNHKMFTIFDNKVGAYMDPYTAQSTGAGIRIFLDGLRDKRTTLSKHPGDFELFEINEFSHIDGALALPIDTPKISLGTGIQILSQAESNLDADTIPLSPVNGYPPVLADTGSAD